MTEPVFWPGLAVALALPWCAGVALVHAVLRPGGRYNLPLLLGHGYLLGLFLTTVVIRAWDAWGLELHFAGLCAALLAMTSLACIALWRVPAGPVGHPLGAGAPGWQLVVAAGLLGLLAWRHLGLAQEMLGRPLYAWDAWVNWAPKAIVWFHLGELADFMRPEQWLRQETADAYTLGNWRAATYPETVPLILLWTMLGAQTPDASALYLPWLLAPLALGLGLYGHLRLAHVPVPGSVIAVYLLLSLPYVNVHSALAGYADIWLASAFCLAVCSLYEWRSSHRWSWGLLALLLATMCTQLKNPGLVLGVIAVLGVAWGAVHWRGRTAAALAAALAGLAGVFLIVGIDVDVPGFGRLALGTTQIEAGRLGRFELGYHAVLDDMARAAFILINWHLLWYLLPVFSLYCLFRGPGGRPPQAELLAALVFVLFVFMFTPHFRAAENQTTLSRALMYTVGPLLFCAALAWTRRCGGREPAAVSENITNSGAQPGH